MSRQCFVWVGTAGRGRASQGASSRGKAAEERLLGVSRVAERNGSAVENRRGVCLAAIVMAVSGLAVNGTAGEACRGLGVACRCEVARGDSGRGLAAGDRRGRARVASSVEERQSSRGTLRLCGSRSVVEGEARLGSRGADRTAGWRTSWRRTARRGSRRVERNGWIGKDRRCLFWQSRQGGQGAVRSERRGSHGPARQSGRGSARPVEARPRAEVSGRAAEDWYGRGWFGTRGTSSTSSHGAARRVQASRGSPGTGRGAWRSRGTARRC